MKKYLAAHDPAETKKQLVGQLNRFARYYNTERPHRGVGRRTPVNAFGAREKVGPLLARGSMRRAIGSATTRSPRAGW